MLISGDVRAGACFICGAGVWFNLSVAGIAVECFIRVGPVCRCGRCVLYTDRNQDRSRRATNHRRTLMRPILIVATGLGFETRHSLPPFLGIELAGYRPERLSVEIIGLEAKEQRAPG